MPYSGVQFVTNAGSLAANRRLMAKRIDGAFYSSSNTARAAMLETAIQLSSGSLSQKQLNAMGNPYGVGYLPGQAGVPDYIINAQSGDFRRSWHCEVVKVAGGWSISLWNDSPHAKYMMGTVKMRIRAITDEVLLRTYPAADASLRRSVRRILEGGSGAGTSLNPYVVGISAGRSSLVGALSQAM